MILGAAAFEVPAYLCWGELRPAPAQQTGRLCPMGGSAILAIAAYLRTPAPAEGRYRWWHLGDDNNGTKETGMFIKIDLKDDIDNKEAVRVARKIIDALDDADKIPDEITEISLGGYPDIWISDEANDRRELLERALQHLTVG